MNGVSGINDSLKETLRGMGIHVVDIETTGLDHKKDKMFSAASQSSVIDMQGNFSSPKTQEGFFNVLNNATKKRTAFNTDKEYIDYLETELQNRHSDKVWGKTQKDAGSLREVAEAYSKGQTTTSEKFLEEFKNNLNKGTGELLVTHNSNFESTVFNKDRELRELNGNKSAPYQELQQRNLHNIVTPFQVSNRLTGSGSLTADAGKYYYNTVIAKARSGSKEELREALGEYSRKHVKVVNQITKEIKQAKASNKTVAIDSMHLSSALMAFGGLSGDVDVHNLMSGNSVGHQAQHFLKQTEAHTAAGDSLQQHKLFQLFTEEIDKFRSDPNYKSTMLQEFNTYLNENSVTANTIKEGMLKEVKEIHRPGSKKTSADLQEWKDKLINRASILPQKEMIDVNRYIHGFSADYATHKSVEGSEKYHENYTPNIKAKSPGGSLNSIANTAYSKISTNKKILGGVGLLAGANLFLGGGEKGKDKKANTYNELYDSTYFGTPLVDWQNRNNAHKVLY